LLSLLLQVASASSWQLVLHQTMEKMMRLLQEQPSA
jgi:hypothetical protein